MPQKGDVKRATQARYRATRSSGYFAWLYARRRLRFEKAETFRAAIEAALELPAGEAERVLREALDDADAAEVEVGNRYDHERDEPYYQVEGMMLGAVESD